MQHVLAGGGSSRGGASWLGQLERAAPELVEALQRHRQYNGASLQHLLRAVRNTAHHGHDRDWSAVSETLMIRSRRGSLSEQHCHEYLEAAVLELFTGLFPGLWLTVWEWSSGSPECRADVQLSKYFP